MKKVKINNIDYVLEKDYKDAFVLEEVIDLCTDYFETFDYIFGDYSYSKLRLIGFYESNNKKAKDINNINGLDAYIKDYCSFDSNYFLLHKEKDK